MPRCFSRRLMPSAAADYFRHAIQATVERCYCHQICQRHGVYFRFSCCRAAGAAAMPAMRYDSALFH